MRSFLREMEEKFIDLENDEHDEDEEVKKPVPTSKSILQDIKKMKIEEKSHKSVSDESKEARLKKFVSLKVI